MSLNRHERRAAKWRFRDLLQTARDIHKDSGFTIRESVNLAAEHLEPYPTTADSPFWRRNPYEKNPGEYRFARHFIPGAPWRGGNRWEH